MQGRPTMYRSRSTSWQHLVISMKLQSPSRRQLPRTCCKPARKLVVMHGSPG
jgi:hypothetical protein